MSWQPRTVAERRRAMRVLYRAYQAKLGERELSDADRAEIVVHEAKVRGASVAEARQHLTARGWLPVRFAAPPRYTRPRGARQHRRRRAAVATQANAPPADGADSDDPAPPLRGAA